MFRSLWFRLSVWFSLLVMSMVILLTIIACLSLGYREFKDIVTPKMVYGIAQSEQLLFAESLKKGGNTKWLRQAEENLVGNLFSIQDEELRFYLRDYSNPELYFQIYDKNGKLAYSSSEHMPGYAEAVFSQKSSLKGKNAHIAERLPENGYIWVTIPLEDDGGQVRGSLAILFIAEFNASKLIFLILESYLTDWWVVLIDFSILGLACGLIAQKIVTGPLKRMNQVTAVWREGNFSPRINVSPKVKDILAEHSRGLNAMADELEALFALRQQVAVTEERNRVARELHDTVKQNLFALKLQLAVIKNKSTEENVQVYINEAQEITTEAQQDIMEILTQLHPSEQGKPLLEQKERSFYGRLAALGEDTQRRYGVSLLWKNKAPLELQPEQEHTLSRLAQEAVSNAVRHGKATEIVMDITKQDGRVCWTIQDNGQGITSPKKTEPQRAGLGLAFMSKRVGELPEGSFSLDNSPSGGAVACVEWRECA